MRAAIALLALVLGAAGPALAQERAWNFRVFLDGSPIGTHRFELAAVGGETLLRSTASFDVRLLFLSVYKYDHAATERWNGDCLVGMSSRTVTNGTTEEVTAATREGSLRVRGTAARGEHAGCVMSFAYWNPRMLAEKRLLNSQTGELVPVSITSRGAGAWRITGPKLSIDLRYEGDEWVGLESTAGNGAILRYERQ